MKKRCANANDQAYRNYGGRGISVCDEWKIDFKNFYEWSIANGYEEELTIDRRDNDGNYEPSNCRWVTSAVQSKNRRSATITKSGVKGVYWNSSQKNWRVRICTNYKMVEIGSFDNLESAIKARRDAELKYWN